MKQGSKYSTSCYSLLKRHSPKELAGLTAVVAGLVGVIPTDLVAATILDTGTPTGDPFFLFPHQGVAGEFSLVSDTKISNIEAFIGPSGDVAIRLYDDGGDVPGSLLHSTAFTLAAASEGWTGFSDLNWSIPSGTYWIALESFATSFFLRLGPPAPLGNDASGFGSFLGVDWAADPGDDLNFGVRISGTTTTNPVPEGGSILGLSALGLFATAAFRCRVSRRACNARTSRRII